MGKSNKQKAMVMMSNPVPVSQQERNEAELRIKVEKKMVDGKEVLFGCIERGYEMTESGKMPLEKEYSTKEEFKAGVSAAIDGLYKKVV